MPTISPQNVVPGVQEFEERAYWRDVGTLTALAAAQQDAMGHRPRFNLWNRRWPIRGEYDAALAREDPRLAARGAAAGGVGGGAAAQRCGNVASCR